MGSDRAGHGADMLELAGLARALEAGGIYNGAKVARALLQRELTRSAIDSAPREGSETSSALDRLARRLEAEGDDPAVVAALRAAARAASSGATLALRDAPRTWTCRACGRISIAVLPEVCPACEAPAAAAQEHIPIWYLEPMSTTAALEELEAGSASIESAVAGRDDEVLARPPRSGEWSAREVLQHLVAAEELLAVRVPRMLDEDEPELVAAAAWILPASDDATVESDLSASALLVRHQELRQATLARLRRLDVDDWQRRGRHPEWGTVTVLTQSAYFARHLWSHLAQLRAAAEGRVPGER